MNRERIITECFTDTELIKTIGFSRRDINHQKSKGTASRAMTKKYKNRIVVAVIDRDKLGSESNYFQTFKDVRQENNLVQKRHNSETHFLIVFSPALERFLVETAVSAGVTPMEFSMPSNAKALGGVIKDSKIESNQNYLNFLYQLVQADQPQIQTLRKWLQEIQLL